MAVLEFVVAVEEESVSTAVAAADRDWAIATWASAVVAATCADQAASRAAASAEVTAV